ncbi:DNA polymerase [Polyangium spumosum]|uniref:DNA-directed DNA polymerase family A palm domain-containing protein n=1 Tax=Polyangium spumosum TaxID=889282 RepID=A0A6N7PX19_9BACT|nr:DNA polymerase [Polyangium spumosum]MRG94634.1 hypothetical protein [Polyangium spumosum]
MSQEEQVLSFELSEEIPMPAEGNGATEPSSGKGSKKGKGPSIATQLVELAKDVELFHTPDGRAFATIEEKGHKENWPVRSKQFSRWLVRRYFHHTASAPNTQALQEALSLLEARAQFEGDEEPVHVRVAAKNGAGYLDLGDRDWRAVEITSSGWQIVANPPVKFRRPRGMQPLPVPVPGGNVTELRPYVNVGSDEAFYLLVSWLVGAMKPRGPYVILALQGEQASAKSTTARVLRRLVDPSTAPLRRAPHDERDLMIAAQNGWVMSFDNLSGLPVWLSDAICCIATGGGLSTRELFTDDDEILFSASRPVILNGIDAIAVRADLADRSMVSTLPPIPEDRRQDEATFWTSFEQASPRILGALLDGVSTALRNIGSVTLPFKPRMADFALWATAAEPAFGWPRGTFIKAYSGNRAQAVDQSLEGDVVAMAVRELLARQPDGIWEGSATELHTMLREFVPVHVLHTRDWPQAANTLTNRLRRAAPALRAVGITYEDLPRSGKVGVRRLRLIRTAPQGIVSIVGVAGTAASGAVTAAHQADGPMSTTGDVDGLERQPWMPLHEADHDDDLAKADGADDADGLRAAGFGGTSPAVLIHRDTSTLSALAAAITGAGKVGLAVLTTGPDAPLEMTRVVGIALPNGDVHVIDVRSTDGLGAVADALREVLIVGHDLKPTLARLASDFEVETRAHFDTMIARKLLDGGLHLEDERFFTLASTCEAAGVPRLVGDPVAASEPAFDARFGELVRDVKPLLALEEAMREALEADELEKVAALENPLLPVISGMELVGVPVDLDRWEQVVAAWTGEAQRLRTHLALVLGVQNVDNGAEVLLALRRHGIPVERTKSEDLAPYMHIEPVAQLVRYRHINGFVVGAGRGVLRSLGQFMDGRVVPALDQLGASSGRFSCRTPNLLGLPREPEVRRCIRATPGNKIVVSDYAAIELRVLADRIGEKKLIDVFHAGSDPHRLTASLLMGVHEAAVTPEQRRRAKAVNFGFTFGMGAESFVAYARKNYDIELSISEAAEFKELFLAAYPGIAEWQRRMQEEMPFIVRTGSGRLRYFPDQDDEYGGRLSHGIQGTAADGMKKALVLLHNHPRFRELRGSILLVIHDELLVEAPEEHAEEVREIVVACMVEGMSTFVKAVPIVVESEVRDTWAKEAGRG